MAVRSLPASSPDTIIIIAQCQPLHLLRTCYSPTGHLPAIRNWTTSILSVGSGKFLCVCLPCGVGEEAKTVQLNQHWH